MPLQNRVDPWGQFFRTSARGNLMGNRGGVLHNDERQIVRSHAGKRWIHCLLTFKGRHRPVMSPNAYTELFFLDEAVALSAGHRPCAECQRPRFLQFREAWRRSRAARGLPADTTGEMDAAFHAARWNRKIGKPTFRTSLASLPAGVFIVVDGTALLWCEGQLWPWQPDGYGAPVPAPDASLRVEVLTPEPIVECIRYGYVPSVHLPRA